MLLPWLAAAQFPPYQHQSWSTNLSGALPNWSVNGSTQYTMSDPTGATLFTILADVISGTQMNATTLNVTTVNGGNINGNGSGLTSLNASALTSGTVPMSALNTPTVATNENPEVYNYVTTNGITDLSAVTALNGMENEFKKYGIWSNVLDVIPWYARFNPTNGRTFYGRSFTNRNLVVGNWGLTNVNTTIIIRDFPLMTNGSMLIVYGKCPTNVPAVSTSVAGWFNVGAGKTNEFFMKNTPVNYDGLVSVTNNVTWASAGITGDFPNSYLAVYMGSDAAAGNSNNIGTTSSGLSFMGNDQMISKYDFVSFNTNGTASHYRNGVQDVFAQNTTPNTAIPMLFFAPFTNIFIGQDPSGQYAAPSAQIAAVFVFNCEAGSNIVMAATRAARWLDPSPNNYVLIGDSRMWENGLDSFDGGMQTDAANNNTSIFNFAGSGQYSSQFTNSIVSGGRIALALSTFANLGCVQNNRLLYGLSVNDYLLQGLTAAQAFTMMQTFQRYVPSSYLFTAGTVWPMATNSSLATPAQLLSFNASIATFNKLILTNANTFSGGFVDQAAVATPYIGSGTNASYSIDGLHFYGPSGYLPYSYLAQAWTRPQNNQYMNPSFIASFANLSTVTVGASPFSFTNNTSSRLEAYINAGTGTTAVTKNGSSVYGALSGADTYVLLQPGCWMTLTYSIGTPTVTTNAW